MSHHKVRITVNGTPAEDEVEARLLLVHYLRDVRGLTGTHVGCDTSNCGACTVLLDGRTVKSCTVFTVTADGGDVLTIEGLAEDERLSPVQEGFRQCHGLQCGYCTPGMVLSATGLLLENADPDEEAIRHGIEGNLCRCTGYDMIVDSVRWAAENGGAGEVAQRHANALTETA
jgi:carbon-monoxide dehydrogenase small subunit